MKLLRLATTLNSTSAPYNQFSLGLKSEVNQTFCSLFKNDIAVHSDIDAFNGEGSIFKMLRILKNLLYKNDFDVIHVHSGLTGIIFLISLFPFKLKLLRKTVFTLHNSWEVLKIRNQILDFIIMCLSEKVCTCGESSRKSIPPLVDKFINKKTIAVVNGFDHKRIDDVDTSRSSDIHYTKNYELKIVCVGALNKTKNQIALLEALKKSKLSAEIIFLGDGNMRESLLKASKQVPDNIKINFKGRVSRDLAIEHMLEADVSISLSKGEGLPIAILESMYAGCFMVLSKIPPHNEISPPEERCMYVDSEDEDQIKEALKYISVNLNKIKGSRSLSREYSIKNFSANNMLSTYKEIYKSL